MLDRIVLVSHEWPGITPFNVWDLTLEMWLRYARAADRLEADRG